MEKWMWILALVILALPVLLMWAFNGVDRADSRGRRKTQRWRAS